MSTAATLTDELVLNIFRGLVFGVQRMRSISREESGLSDEFLAEIHPWLFGPKCILPTLLKITEDLEKGGSVAGLTVFNIVRLMERHGVGALMSANGFDIPEADLAWAGQGPFKGPVATH
jgi:hypothetical protein